MLLRLRNRLLLLFFLSFSLSNLSFGQSTEKLLKDANALFKTENYIEATPKYLQLLSLEPRNSFYNYRYGACLLFNSEKKPDALKYLKFAANDPEVDPEAHYYLARAYHLNYYFDKAIKSYLTYKGLVKDKTALKRDVDRQIEMCRNGQKLMSRISDIVVKERKTSNFGDFFRAYNLKDIGGSIIVTAAFQTKIDRKKGHEPVVHILDGRDIIFYSSYGEVDEDQKDIYYRVKNRKDEWGDPVKLPDDVNTPFDDDFPYLDPNGKYLYFSSKGHNSMGGYDIFRIPVNLEEMKFGKVENLDFAISSPDDDVFYVVDKDYKHAYFASARQSEGGKIHVYRVLVNKFESNALLLAGDFISSVNPQAKNATIQIRELSTGKIIDQIKTNPSTGSLSFSLPRGGKYELIIQTENAKNPQIIPYNAPFYDDSRLLKLNVIEEMSGTGVSLRIEQDDYYEFTEEQRADALAELFISKAELQPNIELLELLEPTLSEETSLTVNESLKKLNLDKFSQEQLSVIANQDLNRLKENYRRNEEQRKIFLQLASDKVDEAQRLEQAINALLEKAKNEGLTQSEYKELQSLDKSRSQYLAQAVAANKMAENLKQNSAYIQGDIAKADHVRQRIDEALKENNFQVLDNLSDAEKTFVRENFNRVVEKDAARIVGVQNIGQRLNQIDESLEERTIVQQQLAESEREMTTLRESIENAKKRDVPALQKKAEELEATIESLQRMERVLARKSEGLMKERDSLQSFQMLFNESQSISPSQVASATQNNRLIETKLKTELAKNISSQVAVILESAIPQPDPTDISTDETASSTPGVDDKFREQIRKNDLQIAAVERELMEVKDENLKRRTELTNEKGRLLRNKRDILAQLANQSNNLEAVEAEIEKVQLLIDVNENLLAELQESMVIAGSDEIEPNDNPTNYRLEIEQIDSIITDNREALLNVAAGDYAKFIELELQHLNALNSQKNVLESWLNSEQQNDLALNRYEALNQKISNSEKRLAELNASVEAAQASNMETSNIDNPMSENTVPQTPNNESSESINQLNLELENTRILRAKLEQSMGEIPDDEKPLRIEKEKERIQLLNREINLLNQLLAQDAQNSRLRASLNTIETALSNAVKEVEMLESALVLSNESTSNENTSAAASSQDIGERAIAQLRQNNNIQGNIREIDKSADENLMRVQRYETALERLLEDDELDIDTRSKVQAELKAVNEWLDEVSNSEALATSNQQPSQSQESNSELSQSAGDRALIELKNSYNLSQPIREIDKASEENLIRLQRYESALENMLADDRWDEETKSKIRSELQEVNTWLDVASAVEDSPQVSVGISPSSSQTTNRTIGDSNRQGVRVVSKTNQQAVDLAQNLDDRKLENERLVFELENATSPRDERRLIKKIQKNEEQVTRTQYELLLTESADYDQVMEDLVESLDDDMKRNPLVKSEFFILTQKLDEVQEVIDVLQITNRANRERVLVQAMNMRDDFIEQLSQLQIRINEKREVDQLVKSQNLDPSILDDPRRLEYVLTNVNEEIEKSQEKIAFLERNLGSYAKSEQPRVQNDIDDLKIHLEDMMALKRETQKKIQNRESALTRSSQIPSLSNNAQDRASVNNLSDEELVNVLNDPSFLSLRNDLVTFRMLEIRALNVVNRQKSLRHEMQNLVNRIAKADESVNVQELRDELTARAVQYKGLEEQIQFKERELQRLRSEIENNTLYQKNPTLYNALASSDRIQDVLVQANTRAQEANVAPVQSSGITFLNSENQNRSQNFDLNPVSIPGMIYKIQIGAFNRPIDISTFADFNPVTTDQVGNSIRYSAGLFYNKNQAFSALNPIKALGYRDAFVVAYCDGVRYSVAEADELLRQGRCALNNAGDVAFEATARQNTKLTYNQGSNAAPAMTLEDSKGLLFTVQIGVYNTPRTLTALQNLEPLNTQLTERNQIRYSVGRFDDVQAAIQQRNEVRSLGFNDAFVVAYYNGERVSIADAQSIYREQGDLALYNRQQVSQVVVADLKIENPITDSVEQLELLTTYPLSYRIVSKSTFSKAPIKLIQQLRDANVWTFFDESKGRVVSAVVSQDITVNDKTFELLPFYQGFHVRDTAEITFQNLEGYNSEENYYQLTMSWNREMPALVAHMLLENFTYAVSEWIAEEGVVKFAPLNFVQKERIRKSLGAYGGVRFSERVVTF